MDDVTKTLHRYLSMLNETDPERRAELVAQAWTADGRWVDPPLEAVGHAAISDMVGTIHSHYPDHAFRRVSAIDAHHDQLRFAWELVGPDGTVAIAGTDVGEVDETGRLWRIAGFIGELQRETAA